MIVAEEIFLENDLRLFGKRGNKGGPGRPRTEKKVDPERKPLNKKAVHFTWHPTSAGLSFLGYRGLEEQ